MHTKLTVGLALTIALSSAPVSAALPLTFEDLIVEKDGIKIDLSLSYANFTRQGIAQGELNLVQTGPNSFIAIPQFYANESNSDVLVGSLGLRYGLTNSFDIYARTSAFRASQRSGDGVQPTSSVSRDFSGISTGVNYQFKGEDATPALLGYFEAQLMEKVGYSTSYFKSAAVGFTVYRSIDPVVFSLSAGYQFGVKRSIGGVDFKPGALLYLNPSAAFAANDKVTFTMGLQWAGKNPDRTNVGWSGSYQTVTDLVLGVGYGLDTTGNVINVSAKSNISGSRGAEVRMSWSYPLKY